MVRYSAIFAFVLTLAFALPASSARITFDRVIRPAHDLGSAEQLAVIYAIGDNDKVGTFVDLLVDHGTRTGRLHIENDVENNLHVYTFDEASLRALRRRHPADAYIGVSLFTCAAAERGELPARLRGVVVFRASEPRSYG